MTSGRRAAIGVATAAVIALAVVRACGSSTRTAQRGGAFTDAELRFGVAPVPDASVVYQPDVVIVGGGAESVRSMSADGLSWTIDARARHADELVPGKIMFVTGRALGRVLAVTRKWRDLTAIVGPVGLTEVIRDANLTLDQPVDFDDVLTYRAPDLPGTVSDMPPIASAATGPRGFGDRVVAVPVTYAAAAAGEEGSSACEMPAPVPPAPAPGPSKGPPPAVTVAQFSLSPIMSKYGIGLHASSDTPNTKIAAHAMVRLKTPRLSFDLHITRSHIDTAAVTLSGAAGLAIELTLGSAIGRSGNISCRFALPADLTIPLGHVLAVPFAATINHEIIIKTAVAAKNSTLNAVGNYSFQGSFSVGLVNDHFTVGGPAQFTVNESLVRSMTGVALAPEGMVVAHGMRLMVGLGAFGFATGPFAKIITSVSTSRGSDIGLVLCKGATLDMDLGAGVGYQVPQPIVKGINVILRALNIKPIEASGGLFLHEPSSVVHTQSTVPQVKLCKG